MKSLSPLLILLILSSYAYAFADTIDYNGLFRDSNGLLYNGTLPINFSAMDQATDAQTYSEKLNVNIRNGTFSYVIGKSKLIDRAIWQSHLYYRIIINNTINFTPQNFSRDPYAWSSYWANDSDYLGGIISTSYATQAYVNSVNSSQTCVPSSNISCSPGGEQWVNATLPQSTPFTDQDFRNGTQVNDSIRVHNGSTTWSWQNADTMNNATLKGYIDAANASQTCVSSSNITCEAGGKQSVNLTLVTASSTGMTGLNISVSNGTDDWNEDDVVTFTGVNYLTFTTAANWLILTFNTATFLSDHGLINQTYAQALNASATDLMTRMNNSQACVSSANISCGPGGMQLINITIGAGSADFSGQDFRNGTQVNDSIRVHNGSTTTSWTTFGTNMNNSVLDYLSRFNLSITTSEIGRNNSIIDWATRKFITAVLPSSNITTNGTTLIVNASFTRQQDAVNFTKVTTRNITFDGSGGHIEWNGTHFCFGGCN